MELKAQYDAQCDRTALTLRPPLLTTYDQVQKMKGATARVVIPYEFDEAQWMNMPRLISVGDDYPEIEKRVTEHLGSLKRRGSNDCAGRICGRHFTGAKSAGATDDETDAPATSR
jgi:hypothetical protein